MSQPKFVRFVVMAGSLACALSQPARADDHVAVIKNDRVNLRAKPNLNAEVVAQANTGDRLAVVSLQDGWIGVNPPVGVDVWAHRDFIKDGTSTVKSLNLRAGPGINYSIVGTLNRDEAVEVRGQFGEWIKVAADRATLWVSSDFADVVTPIRAGDPIPVPVETSEAAPATPTAESASDQSVVLPVPEPVAMSGVQESPPVLAPSAKAPPADLRLVPLEGQGRLVQREGELKPAPLLFGRPSAFRLVKREGVQLVTICYIRGNTAQLNSLMNENLIVHGREYWVQGVRQPVVVLERIERRAPSSRP